jgi:hypothetical protein
MAKYEVGLVEVALGPSRGIPASARLMRQGTGETKVLRYHYYETVGTRTIFGTRWPIVAFASADHRQYRSGLLCNGLTERVKELRALREAVIRAKGLAPP